MIEVEKRGKEKRASQREWGNVVNPPARAYTCFFLVWRFLFKTNTNYDLNFPPPLSAKKVKYYPSMWWGKREEAAVPPALGRHHSIGGGSAGTSAAAKGSTSSARSSSQTNRNSSSRYYHRAEGGGGGNSSRNQQQQQQQRNGGGGGSAVSAVGNNIRRSSSSGILSPRKNRGVGGGGLMNRSRKHFMGGGGGVGRGGAADRHQLQLHQHAAATASTSSGTSGGGGGGGDQASSSMMHVAETLSGIEVSFSDELRGSASAPGALSQQQQRASRSHGGSGSQQQQRRVKGMISFSDQMAKRRKIYRSQYCTSASRRSAFPPTAEGEPPAAVPVDFKVGRHRVPIFGRRLLTAFPTFDDALFLLRGYEVRDEHSCVRDELAKVGTEISALEKDRNRLEERALNLVVDEDDDGDDGEGDGSASSAAAADGSSSSAAAVRRKGQKWDVHTTLASPAEILSQQERGALQKRRGLALTVCLHNQQARGVFLARCGSVASVIRAEQQRARNGGGRSSRPATGDGSGDGDVICLRPETCRDGGAAATIQHVALLKGAPTGGHNSGGSASDSAFFISRDKGKSYFWGHLPDRLFRRMKNAGFDPKHHATDLIYLSTGPMGCYYAQFRSGECWWGSIVDDREFDKICRDREWDVHRVAFGAGSTVTDGNGHKHTTTSWIILGRDGRAAWKNLPARLHNKLESRLASEAAPVEVALGCGGSYFVRFLDGTTDYCLPAKAARVCRALEKEGVSITSVSLHPELSRDFIIRHR